MMMSGERDGEMMKKKKKKRRNGERKANAFIIVVGVLGDLSRNKIFLFVVSYFPNTSFFPLLSLLITPTCALTLKVYSHLVLSQC